VPERLMRQQARVRPPRPRPTATTPAPRIRVGYPALDHRPVRLQELTNSLESQLIKVAEHCQIRASKDSVVHVEAFRQLVV